MALGHTLLLGLWPHAPEPGLPALPRQTLQVRQIQAPAGTPSETPTPARPMASADTPPPAAALAVPAPAARGTAPSTARQSKSSAPEPLASEPAAPEASAAQALPDPAGQALPVYPTRLPPALTLHYAWRRGAAQGVATLDWRPEADRYLLSLQGRSAGAAALGWSSQGAFDEAGIAPQRHVESRRGREVRAVNFQRDRGRISFSGPAFEHALPPGAQDRLSWLVQLAGVLAADASLATAGSVVTLWVVGTRGDAAVWTFTVQGRQALELPIGTLADTVHLLREAGGPYDTQVQVWLDPARHHLPVQVQWRVQATGEGMALSLQGLN